MFESQMFGWAGQTFLQGAFPWTGDQGVPQMFGWAGQTFGCQTFGSQTFGSEPNIWPKLPNVWRLRSLQRRRFEISGESFKIRGKLLRF